MKRIMKFISSYNDIFLMYIIVFLNEFILRYNINLDLSKKAILYNFLLLSVISLVLINISKKIRKYISLVICLIITIYSFAQNYHYYFFGTFFSFIKLTIINELGGVLGELYVHFNPKLLLYIIPVVLNIVYLIIDRKNKQDYKFSVVRVTISLFAILIMLFVYNKMNYYPETEEVIYLDRSDQYLYKNMPNKFLFENRFGTLSYIERDIAIIVGKNTQPLTKEDKAKIKAYIINKTKEKNEYTGIFKNKNIVFILAESLAPFGIDEKLTPTLYYLINNGLYFDNFYAPIYPSHTADSEFISLTSMMPSLYSGTTSKVFSKNYYPYSMPKLFINNGYKANSYHSGTKYYYNREAIHESLGIGYLFDKDDLHLKKERGFMININWIDDADLFEATINNTDLSKKFFNFVITGSGHMPYDDVRTELISNVKEIEKIYPDINSEFSYYLAAQMKFDQGLERLLKILKEKNILDDTVIVIFGDHYPYGIHQNIQDEIIFKDCKEYEKNKTPFIIYNPTIKGKKISKLSSTFDILPTIANMFDLDISNAFTIGNDIFSSNKGRVIFPDGSILTEEYYYSTNGLETFNFNNTNNYDREIKEIKDLIELSQTVLISNYYSNSR